MVGMDVVSELNKLPNWKEDQTKFILVSGIEEDSTEIQRWFKFRLKKPLKIKEFNLLMDRLLEV